MTWPSVNLEASREIRGVREIKGEMRGGGRERERERERARERKTRESHFHDSLG